MNDQNTIKLLMVDDEEKFLKSVSQRLSMKGFDVVTAIDGRDAMLAAERNLFDVALLDLQLPGMDGTKVLKLLKQRHKYLEIIILTGHGSVNSAVECTRLGAFDYLEKPFDFDKLIEAIKEAYSARLKKKFEHSAKRIQEIQKLSMRESPLGLLRALAKMDDDEK
jgi:DNA-binding NtrC family response regulator